MEQPITKWYSSIDYPKLAVTGIVALIAGYLYKTFYPKFNTYYLKNITFPRYLRQWMTTHKSSLVIFKEQYIEDTHAEKLIDFFNNIDQNHSVDFVLDTTGGDMSAVTTIQNIMRHHKGRIRIYVPVKAFSGGTTLSLSTNNLWTNLHTQFGPIEAQIWDPLHKVRISSGIVSTDCAELRDSNLMRILGVAKQCKASMDLQLQTISLYQEETTMTKIKGELLGKYTHDTSFSVQYMQNWGVKVNMPCPSVINQLYKLAPNGLTIKS